MSDFLSRVDLSMPIERLLDLVVKSYDLGDLKRFEYIKIGFEDLNIKLVTNKGKYIVKIFSKLCSLQFINEYIQAILKFRDAGIPTPDLLESYNGFLYVHGKTKLCVMRFFEGEDFDSIEPKKEDIIKVTGYLAKIHEFDFNVSKNYDKWSTSHLLDEFASKKDYLSVEDMNVISPVIKNLELVDQSKFGKSVIHGAFEKSNILKNSKSKYCILDLGCMDNNASVMDISIFFAAFCLNPKEPLSKNKNIYDLVLEEYMKHRRLSDYEIEHLPLLVQATYASYILIPSYLLATGTDAPGQTRKFLIFGRNGIRAFRNL